MAGWGCAAGAQLRHRQLPQQLARAAWGQPDGVSKECARFGCVCLEQWRKELPQARARIPLCRTHGEAEF